MWHFWSKSNHVRNVPTDGRTDPHASHRKSTCLRVVAPTWGSTLGPLLLTWRPIYKKKILCRSYDLILSTYENKLTKNLRIIYECVQLRNYSFVVFWLVYACHKNLSWCRKVGVLSTLEMQWNDNETYKCWNKTRMISYTQTRLLYKPPLATAWAA